MSVYSDIASHAAQRCGEGCAKTAVKVAACESGGNPTNTNSLGCYGLYQYCPQNRNRARVVGQSVETQTDVFLEESNNGANLGPWAASKACWSASGGKADKAWEDAVSGAGSLSPTGPTLGGAGIPNPADALGSAISAAVDFLLGGKSPAEIAVRFLELVGGAVILATGGVMILEVLSTPGTRAGKGVVSKGAGLAMNVIPGGAVVKGAAKKVVPT